MPDDSRVTTPSLSGNLISGTHLTAAPSRKEVALAILRIFDTVALGHVSSQQSMTNVLWKEVFWQLFGEYPKGTPEDPSGTTDARWDLLFTHKGRSPNAYRIFDRLIRHREKIRRKPRAAP